MTNNIRKIGVFTKEIINLLNLKGIAENTPIYIGEQNELHIQQRHPVEYDVYFKDIEQILAKPDYIGENPNDNSIVYVKLYEVHGEYIRVGVKVTPSGKFFAKTLHLLSTYNAERYIEKGTLISTKI